ncbi:band 4.1-like protein 2 isoform X10 [Triplophysa dalaica]|uniref:band 4.1-like protein 2 isoform X10 n=1 Tax=Triplophysa dalaica TaxID=1582913 RepID=UPI0024DFF7D4|nr:band 4.1-like protein 2 isoform X10 [Triplophysa dalaica]
MTTEVGTETEVKKEPEKVPEVQQQTEDPEKASDSVAPDNPDKQEEGSHSADTEPNATPEPSSPPPAGEQKKEKGISRFLPPWLKRPKSQSLDTESESVKDEKREEKETNAEPPEEVSGEKSRSEAEKDREEQKSVGSADTQPAREETEGEPDEKPSSPQETSVVSPIKVTKKMKMVVCHVTLLDGNQFTCEVEKRAKGLYLFSEVCKHLNLMEKDYFGLSFKDNAEQRCWLDPNKEIKRQIRNSQWQFAFTVKFYPADPSQLTEDITRYLLCLQLRQDITSGRLPCSFVTHALLGSYALQAELGDYDPEEHRLDYISDFQFAPNQTKELEEKVVELHKSHRGMTPSQADVQFLENAKKLSMYGVDLHHAKDSEGVDIMLGVCANGLLIYKDRLRINRFAWPKILKISYKRSNFYIKIRPGEVEQFESTVGFKLPNHRAAKRVWKVCVEHHTFFRLMSPEGPTQSKFLTLGSKFRYSGRTQAQSRHASTMIDRPAPPFQRTSSKRISRSLDGAPVVYVMDHSRAGDGNGTVENGPALDLNSDSKSLEEELTSLFMSKACFSCSVTSAPAEGSQVWCLSENPPPHPETDHRDASKSSEVKPDVNGQQEVVEVIEETVIIEEVVKAKPKSPAPEVTMETAEAPQVKEERSLSSDSESEEEAEYNAPMPSTSISAQQIKEEPEEEEAEAELTQQAPPAEVQPQPTAESSEFSPAGEEESAAQPEDEVLMMPNEALNGHASNTEAPPTLEDAAEEEEPHIVNGNVSHVETEHLPQVICCSEPPVVKTEMVTISDTFAAQKTEISTKEVPIVHTETKTITYEAAQLDGNGDGEPGVLMTAQTITSESLCTTTTTHITKTLKGGQSETRIEKRIVITGDSDIDHDQALAQAIKEAKEQHPDMSVTRVVVHKETELAEDDD